MIYTLEQFYDTIPKLHRKYKPDLFNAMDTLNITTQQSNFQTTKMIVYASLGCIDSVVNLMCLFSLRKHFNLEVSISFIQQHYIKLVIQKSSTNNLVYPSTSTALCFLFLTSYLFSSISINLFKTELTSALVAVPFGSNPLSDLPEIIPDICMSLTASFA